MVRVQSIFDLVCGCNDYHDSLHDYHDRIDFESQIEPEELQHCMDFVVRWRSIGLGDFVVEDNCFGGMTVNRRLDHDIAGAVLASPLGLDCRVNQSEGTRDEMRLASIVDLRYMDAECLRLAAELVLVLGRGHRLPSCRVKEMQDFGLRSRNWEGVESHWSCQVAFSCQENALYLWLSDRMIEIEVSLLASAQYDVVNVMSLYPLMPDGTVDAGGR